MQKFTQTPIGLLKISIFDGFLTDLYVVSQGDVAEKTIAGSTEDERVAAECVSQLTAYFEGRLTDFDLPIRPRGTEYMQRVWQSICQIPYGQTRTYKQVAEDVANSRHSRSVAMSLHRNPILIVIPCHRIIGSDGSLTGFAAGLDNKQRLLNLEQRETAL